MAQNWSGADLQALINESIYKAIRHNQNAIKSENILEAFTDMISK